MASAGTVADAANNPWAITWPPKMRPQSYGGLRPTNVSAPWGSSSSRAAKSRGIAAAESEAVIGAVSQATTNQQNLKRAQQKQAGQAPRSNRPPRTRPPPGDPECRMLRQSTT